MEKALLALKDEKTNFVYEGLELEMEVIVLRPSSVRP